MLPKTAKTLNVRKHVTDTKNSFGIKKLEYTLSISENNIKIRILDVGMIWFFTREVSGEDGEGDGESDEDVD